MANVCQCDNCKKIIGEDEIKIKLTGYEVSQNRRKRKIPMGYSVGFPQDFCSFDCLAEWAMNEQKMLDDYIELVNNMEQKSN